MADVAKLMDLLKSMDRFHGSANVATVIQWRDRLRAALVPAAPPPTHGEQE